MHVLFDLYHAIGVLYAGCTSTCKAFLTLYFLFLQNLELQFQLS